jgi:hypothetical protein
MKEKTAEGRASTPCAPLGDERQRRAGDCAPYRPPRIAVCVAQGVPVASAEWHGLVSVKVLAR